MRKPTTCFSAMAAAVMLLTLSGGFNHAEAAELLMFDAKDCVVSQKFDREVSDAYAKSNGARVFPLRRIDVSNAPGGVRLDQAVTMTPTFVFVDRGEEIARFVGYPGRDHFLRIVDGAADMFLQTRAGRRPTAPRSNP